MILNLQSIYNYSPWFVKNLLVTIFNLRQIKVHGKRYREALKEYHRIFYNTSLAELNDLQNERFMSLIEFAKVKNNYYKDLLINTEIDSICDIRKIPVLEKDDLRKASIKSNIKGKLLAGKTGGTTGKSIQFEMLIDDYSERQACLDFFRGMYGYHFGDEIAWFSGKEIITSREEVKNLLWVRDWCNHVTYYSTFHLRNDHIDVMIQNILASKPDYFAGFPSAIYAVARRWKDRVDVPAIKLKAVFPTSEPLFDYQKQLISEVFDCKVPDQYASSEGAPFIYECPAGALHYDLYSGVFESLDDSEEPEMLVTSFTTRYMPLIRYRIGDQVVFGDQNSNCKCGSKMPIVNKITGRSVAYVYSLERGKITVSNISNVVKHIESIERFQLVQDRVDHILVRVAYSGYVKAVVQKKLEYELRFRLGEKINLTYEFVDHIPSERNGKFLMIKNLAKNEIESNY